MVPGAGTPGSDSAAAKLLQLWQFPPEEALLVAQFVTVEGSLAFAKATVKQASTYPSDRGNAVSGSSRKLVMAEFRRDFIRKRMQSEPNNGNSTDGILVLPLCSDAGTIIGTDDFRD